MASEERLGDVRLYRVPIAVTVASRSQKQIALLERPAVKVESILRLRPVAAAFDLPLERVAETRNDTSDGLGLALPAGKLELFRNEDGHRLLVRRRPDRRPCGRRESRDRGRVKHRDSRPSERPAVSGTNHVSLG